jgi:uncharacterized membrane protein
MLNHVHLIAVPVKKEGLNFAIGQIQTILGFGHRHQVNMMAGTALVIAGAVVVMLKRLWPL